MESWKICKFDPEARSHVRILIVFSHDIERAISPGCYIRPKRNEDSVYAKFSVSVKVVSGIA